MTLDRFTCVPYDNHRVNVHHRSHRNIDGCPGEVRKACLLDLYLIGTRWEINELIVSLTIGCPSPFVRSFETCERDGRTGDDGSALIRYATHD